MTNEQEVIEYLKQFSELMKKWDATEISSKIDTVLSLIKEQQEKIAKYEKIYKEYDCYRWVKELDKKDKQIDLIKEYAHQEIVHYTETIKDYIDDDKEGNKHYIEELKEEREHWRDIEKILQNKPKEELYMNWWKYGLYE